MEISGFRPLDLVIEPLEHQFPASFRHYVTSHLP